MVVKSVERHTLSLLNFWCEDVISVGFLTLEGRIRIVKHGFLVLKKCFICNTNEISKFQVKLSMFLWRLAQWFQVKLI